MPAPLIIVTGVSRGIGRVTAAVRGAVKFFSFDEIREAHRVMEANEAGGKMVVIHD